VYVGNECLEALSGVIPNDCPGALATFARDADTGQLRFIEKYADEFALPSRIVVSGDGAYVYLNHATLECSAGHGCAVASSEVRLFERESRSGHLQAAGDFPIADLIVMSGDGRYVFAQDPDGLQVFRRNALSGRLVAAYLRGISVDVDASSFDGSNLYGAARFSQVPTLHVSGRLAICSPTPKRTCQAPRVRPSGFLKLVDQPDDAQDEITWVWRKGVRTAVQAFGDPYSGYGFGTTYALCLYMGKAHRLTLSLMAPSGRFCGTGTCWNETRRGWEYADPSYTPDGIGRVSLKAGGAGRASVLVSGQGEALAFPTPPLLPLRTPVTVQLQATNGQCWGAVYKRPLKNGTRGFLARR